MSDSLFALKEDATIFIDAEKLVGAGPSSEDIYRERVQIVGAAFADKAAVSAAQGLQVDVTKVIPGTGATNLGKAIGAVAGAVDVGIAPLAIRDDALSTLSDPEGDYVALRVGNTGYLWVRSLVDHTDDAAFTAGTALMMPAGGLYQATPDLVDDGDAGAFRMTQRRALYVSHETPLGQSMVDDTNDSLNVTVVSNDVGARAVTENGSIADDQSNVLMAASLPYSHDGAAWTRAGASFFKSIDLDESEEQIKGIAGVLYGYHYANLTASTLYLKFYDKTSASVTVGTTVPDLTIPVGANKEGHIFFPPPGVGFATAITAAVTTGIADADSGAPAANAFSLMAFYK